MKSLFEKTKPDLKEVDPCKLLINIGCLMDIPTAKFVRGMKGETLTNGGLSVFTGVAGRANTFKSTIMHYMALSALNTVCESGIYSYLNIYDTEITLSPERIEAMSKRHNALSAIDFYDSAVYSLTDKTIYSGNEWYKTVRTFIKDNKIKNRKQFLVETPFLDRDGNQIHSVLPTFTELDSISEFDTDEIEKIQDKTELGDGDGNMIHMRNGLAKTRLLMDLPYLANAGVNFFLVSAHVGNAAPVQKGPISVPVKVLPHMAAGEKFKGAADKILFLATSLWQTISANALINQGTKGPEYPRSPTLRDEGSSDLQLVKLKMIRSKFGRSGFTIDIVVSQSEGVLPSVSEYHYLREKGMWGFEGKSLALYPGHPIGRTTVREEAPKDAKLRRALTITAELMQFKEFVHDLPFDVPEPKALYEKLKADGYDWDKLLETRGFWTFNNYKHPVKYLSTFDLMEIYYDKYVPYWQDKKELKKVEKEA